MRKRALTCDALPQNVIRIFECLVDGQVGFRAGEQLVIGDDDERVGCLAHRLDRLHRLPHPPRALEEERLRHDADREAARHLGAFGDNRRRARASAAAHARDDEDKVGAPHDRIDLRNALLRRQSADRRIPAGAEPARHVPPDLHLPRAARGRVERLCVRVDAEALNASLANAHHTRDRIAPTAADAEDAYHARAAAWDARHGHARAAAYGCCRVRPGCRTRGQPCRAAKAARAREAEHRAQGRAHGLPRGPFQNRSSIWESQLVAMVSCGI